MELIHGNKDVDPSVKKAPKGCLIYAKNVETTINILPELKFEHLMKIINLNFGINRSPYVIIFSCAPGL